MNDKTVCSKCGTEFSLDAPGGLCPKCLVQAGLESDSPSHLQIDPTIPSPGSTGFQPPSVEQLARRFPQLEILELVGKGGMGAVYKARQPGLDRLVAVKILPPEVGRDPAFAERFTREARAMARLSHPNIVAIHDFGQTDGLFYFVMEYIDGANLRQTMQAGQLKPDEALAIVPQICDALQYAHDEGIVHRDIKPENILLDKKGRVKIADFGLSKLLREDHHDVSLTGTHQVMGTLRYMAPEQMQGTKTVDHRADIYSLGVVFYELLTGELPMGRFDPPSQKVQVDVRLDEVVLRALAQEPAKRYQRASEVKTDVEAVSHAEAATKPVSKIVQTGVAKGQTFEIQMLPRDAKDMLLGAALAPYIFGVFLLIPAAITFGFMSMFGVRFELSFGVSLIVGLLVMLGTFVLLATGSVESVRVNHDGLAVSRYIGPSKFLPWSMIQRIEPMTMGEVFRQVWIWPGLPPRGSIVCGSGQGFYRINCHGDCWYFNPRYAQRFLDAIDWYQQPESSAKMVDEPPPTDDKEELQETIGQPASAMMGVAIFYIVVSLVLIVVSSVAGGLFRTPGTSPLAVKYALWAIALLPIAAVVFEGGRRMNRLRSYWFVVAAAVLACVPFGKIIGIEGGIIFRYACPLIGVWTLITLLRPDVRAAFAASLAPDDRQRTGTHFAWMSLVIIGLIVVITAGASGVYLAYSHLSRNEPGSPLSTGEVRHLDGHTSIVKAVAVSPDGRTLVSTGLDGRVIVRDLPGGKLRHVSTVTVNDSSKHAPLFSLAISPDNTYALAGGNPNQAGTLKVRLDRQHFESIGLPSNGSVKASMFYDEGRKLVYRAGDSEIVCFDLIGNHVITSTPIYPGQFWGNVRASAACPDGRFVAVTSSNMKPDPGGGATSAEPCKLTVFDTAGVERLSWQFADYADFSFAQIAFAGPTSLVACLPSGQMLRWTLDADGKWQPDADSIRIAPGRYTASAVSRNGTVIWLAENRQIVGISTSTGEAVACIDLKIGERLESYASFPIEAIAVTSEPNTIAAALWDGRVALARCHPLEAVEQKDP